MPPKTWVLPGEMGCKCLMRLRQVGGQEKALVGKGVADPNTLTLGWTQRATGMISHADIRLEKGWGRPGVPRETGTEC